MPKIQRLRSDSFRAQRGRCYYCDLPMWLHAPDELRSFDLRSRAAAMLQCTAEHLVARRDGGKDVPANIAAACWRCNSRRHKRKSPPSAAEYRDLVKRRLAKGRWLSPGVVSKLRRIPPAQF